MIDIVFVLKDILSNMTEEQINNINIRNETILHKLFN